MMSIRSSQLALIGLLVWGLWVALGGNLAWGEAAPRKSGGTSRSGRKDSPPAGTGKRSASPATGASDHESTDLAARPVAKVNDQMITWGELAQICMERQGTEVLESLVNKQLILDECNRLGITITQQQVDDEVVAIAGKFRLSVEQWIGMLQKERNISLHQYRNEIVWPMLALRQLSKDRIQVTDEQIDRAFESEYGAKVQASMILVSSKSAAQAIHGEVLAKPDDFGRLAKDKSEDKHSAAARGQLPPIRRHSGEPELEKVAFSLQPGQISPVLKLHDKFVILKCERHLQAAHIAPQFEAEARRKLADRILEENLRSVATELFQKLQADAKVVNVWNQPELRAKSPTVAATINGKPITVDQLRQACFDRHASELLKDEVNFRILRHALQEKGQQVTRQDLDQEIARAAESYGYLSPDGKPDVQRWLKEVEQTEGMSADIYLRDAVWPSVALKKLVAPTVKVTTEDFQKGFEANYGERVEVLAIVLGNQRTAEEVWKMARDNPAQAYFGELANQYSAESISRANFGEVPPIGRHGGQPLVEAEAFKLKPGELSGIVASGDKYVILKCLGRTVPVVGESEKEAVREELTKAIHEKKMRIAMAEEFDRLKDAAQVQELLASVSKAPSGGGRVRAQPVSQSNN